MMMCRRQCYETGVVFAAAPDPGFDSYNPGEDDNFINPEEYRLFGGP